MTKSRYHIAEKKKSTMGKTSASIRKNRIFILINGVKRDVIEDYCKFLLSLDSKNKFSSYAFRVKAKSSQWNVIRRKHITASHIKRLANWNMKSDCLIKR